MSTPPVTLASAFAAADALEDVYEDGEGLLAACRAWDEVIRLAADPGPPEGALDRSRTLLTAFGHRTALAVPVPLELLELANEATNEHFDQIPAPELAELYLWMAIAALPFGLGSYAEVLRTAAAALRYQVPVGDVAAHRRRVRVLLLIASTLLELDDHEEADAHLADAEAMLGLEPLPDFPPGASDEAVRRLVERSDQPILAVPSRDDPRRPQPILVRQLQANSAARAGRIDAAASLYQSLSAGLSEPRASMAALALADALLEVGDAVDADSILAARPVEALAQLRPGSDLIAALAAVGAGDRVRADGLIDAIGPALDATPSAGGHDLLALARARLAIAAGLPDVAAQHFEHAIRLRIAPRRQTMGYARDGLAMRRVLPLAEEALDHLVAHGRAEAALRITELVKSSRLRAMLAGRGATRILPDDLREAGSAVAAVHRERVTALSEQIGEVERQLGLVDEVVGETLRAELTVRRDERRALLAEAALYDPTWVAMTEPDPVDPTRLVSLLGERRSAALTLFRLGDRTVSLVVDGDGTALGVVEDAEPLTEVLARYVENLTAPGSIEAWNDPNAVGLRLTDLVPADILERATAADALAVAAHRQLHLIPWHALRFRDGLLLDATACCVVPSLGVMQAMLEPIAAPEAVGVFGPPSGAPLPGSREEVRTVAAMYGPAVVRQPVAGDDATRSALMAMLTEKDLSAAHLSCHGRAVTEDPLSSGLLTADGVLDATALVGLRFGPEEVVASACSVGWRPSQVGDLDLLGDEALGLPAALLLAGARSFVVSTAKVGVQAASDLSVAYHARRIAGDDPVHAMRRAQLAARDAGHPIGSWAGLTIYAAPTACAEHTNQEVPP
jgi:CHAT domain-containing protein